MNRLVMVGCWFMWMCEYRVKVEYVGDFWEEVCSLNWYIVVGKEVVVGGGVGGWVFSIGGLWWLWGGVVIVDVVGI